MANSIPTPQIQQVVKSMYVSSFDIWLDNPKKYLAWAKREGANSLNCYGRTYLQSSSGRKKIAAFVLLARTYGIIEVFFDYRGTNEITYWRKYFSEFPDVKYKIHPITEIEPYRTGKYAEFYAAIKEEKKLSIDFGLISGCYMGQPSQEGWNEIAKYCSRIYLSHYISMKTYNSGNGFNYVEGNSNKRFSKIAAAAKLANKVNIPVVLIKSLEKIAWGAENDFQGDLYIKNSFYGNIYNQDVADYNSKTSNEVKIYTYLIGTCIFSSKYALKARPI